jgi:hypothetical protein
MKTLCIIGTFLVLAISCGGDSSSKKKEPQQETASCNITDQQIQNVHSVFNTLSTKGTITGNASFNIAGVSANNGTGQISVTPQSSDSWQMNGKFCTVANQCTNQNTSLEIKNGCLLFDGKETSIVSSDDTHLNTNTTTTTAGVETSKVTTNISTAGKTAISTSSTALGRSVGNVNFTEQ